MRKSLSVLALLTMVGASSVAAAGPIKVGYLAGISGVCGVLTVRARSAMEMAIEDINARGGLLGRKVELIVRDSKTKPDEGAKQYRDLAQTEKVDLVTGVCSSSVFMGINPVAEETKIPLFSNTSGTHKTTVDFFHPYVYQLQPNTLMEGAAMAEYVKRKGWKRIVTIGMDYEWGRTTVAVFKEQLAEKDPSAKVVKELWPKFGETNLASFITATLNEKPDAVVAVTAGVTATSLIKQGQTYGMFKRTQVLTSLFTDSLVSLGEDMPDGIHGWARAPFWAIPGAQEFVQRFRAKYNDYPDDWAVLHYDSMVNVIAPAIEKAGSTDPMKLRAALTSMTFKTMRGDLKIRALDHTLNSPSYIGVSRKTSQYPFSILENVEVIPGDITLPSPATVAKLRAAAR